MVKKVAKVTGLEGNNESSNPKQGNKYTFYCFTKFYDSDLEIENFQLELKKVSIKYLFGYEICPKTKKNHLQGFMQLKERKRITELLSLKCNLINCKGTEEQNKDYCSKDGLIIKWGYPKEIKIISNLYDWQKMVQDVCLQEPDGRTINWFWDEVGNKGKSAFCKYMFVKHNTLVIQGGKLADIMNIIFNTNMDIVECIIIDVPRCNGNNISYNAVECILNGMITNTKYETGVKVFNPPNVIVFSNFEPIMEKLSEDRWKIINLNDVPTAT